MTNLEAIAKLAGVTIDQVRDVLREITLVSEDAGVRFGDFTLSEPACRVTVQRVRKEKVDG